MSVGFSHPRNPNHIPEHSLWTVRKGSRVVEAGTRMTPLGPELRIYDGRGKERDLMWSRVLRDGCDIGELAETERQQLEAQGYMDAAELDRLATEGEP